MKRSYRIGLAAIVVVAVIAIALVVSARSSGIVISIWTRLSSSIIQPVVDAYNAQQAAAGKSIRLEHTSIPPGEFVAKLTEAVKAKKAPDLVVFDLVDGPRYSAMGAFLDLSGRFDSLTMKDKLNTAMLRLGTREGRVYALPVVADVSVLFYNRKLFSEAGLDPDKPPTTWEELRAAAQKLTKDGVAGFELWCGDPGWTMFTLMPYIWANGGKLLSDDGAKAMLDDPRTVEAVQFLADMAVKDKIAAPAGTAEGCAANDPATPISFDKGTIAIAPRSAAQFGRYISSNPSPDVKITGADLGVALFPGKATGSASAFIGGDLIAISANSQQADEAWNVVQYALSAEVQNSMIQGGFVPVRSDLVDNPIYSADPRYKVFAQALAVGSVPFSPIYADLYAPIQAGFKAALSGEKPVAEALQAANLELQKRIDAR